MYLAKEFKMHKKQEKHKRQTKRNLSVREMAAADFVMGRARSIFRMESIDQINTIEKRTYIYSTMMKDEFVTLVYFVHFKC